MVAPQPVEPGPARIPLVRPVAGLTTRWDFVPSRPDAAIVWRRWLRSPFYVRGRPRQQAIIPVRERSEWIGYFVFAPEQQLSAAHHYTLARLRDEGLPLLIVCASPAPGAALEALRPYAQALYWKGMGGYDFSAYRVMVEEVASRSPGARLMVLNDSVYGPFHEVGPFLRDDRWALSGFTASASDENHLQSYAFVLQDVSPATVQALRPVMMARLSFNRPQEVILLQELRLGRVAARHMRVGAHWYSDRRRYQDPCLQAPFELIEAGMPFLKKSLIKRDWPFQRTEEVTAFLRAHQHPLETRAAA